MKVLNKILVSLSIASVLFFSACEDRSDLTAPAPPSTGNVNFSHFVSIGNSLTAGYQSGSLFKSAQEYSFGNQIAKMLGVNYVQPLFADPGTPGRLEFGGFTSTSIVMKVNTNQGLPLNTNYAAPFNNLGIPGSILYDLMDETDFAAKSTARANPLFSAVLRSSAFGASIIKQALAQTPTFITLWIGNNDVLGYATSGGTSGTDITGKLPTNTQVFSALYAAVGAQLAASGAKVAVANIPPISAIPYFTTVPAALQNPLDGSIITLYGETTTGVRALVPGQDLLVLTASQVLLNASGQPTGVGLSPANPLTNKYVLDKDEVVNVTNAITSFNQTIASVAAANNFALVDINTYFYEFAAKASGKYVGKIIDGIKFTPDFVTGNLFSLDGVHPSSQGQAIIANKFIDAINAKWGSSIPKINVSTVPASIIIGKKVGFSQFGIPIFEKGAFDNILF